jgi:hypothetical protein
MTENLFAESDEQLWDRWKTPLCFRCDYGGPCVCSMAGRILAGRGYHVTDKFGKLVDALAPEA